MTSKKTRENRLRRWAGRLGYVLHKDRGRAWSLHRQGGYMLVFADINAVAQGADFDLSLDEVETFLAEEETRLRSETRV